MSDVTYVSCDTRVYPNKELFAVDMAELINCSHLGGKHRIQGCDVTLDTTNHTLSMTSGRVVIWGRLGVVEGGIIQPPTISSTSSEVECHVVAICDLADTVTPFSIRMVTPAEYETLTQNAVSTEEQIRNFNASNLMDFFDFGVAKVAPATGYVTSWTVSYYASGWGTGRDIWNNIINFYTLNRDGITNLRNTHNSDIAAINNRRNTDITNLNNSINNVNSRVTSYASDISKNTSDISTNANNIRDIKEIVGPGTFTQMQSTMIVTWNETTVHKRNGVCMLTYNFIIRSNYSAGTTLFNIGTYHRPYKRLRFFLIEWNTGARYRATIASDGNFIISDAISASDSARKTFMGELTYLTTTA